MLDLTGYVLTFDDEFTTRSISQTGAGSTWADIRSQWRYDVYRSYDTAARDHVYTASTSEKAAILAGNPTYVDEGAAFATPAPGAGTQDVFRFYDTATDTHFFTASTAERDSVIAHLPSLHYEGVAFQAYASAGADAVTLERFYDATTHLHHFALPDEAEGMRRGSAGPNWVDEGPGLVVGAARPGAS